MVLPVMSRPKIAPVMANGMENMTINGYRRDSNWDAMIINTKSTATTIAVYSLPKESFIISIMPPNS